MTLAVAEKLRRKVMIEHHIYSSVVIEFLRCRVMVEQVVEMLKICWNLTGSPGYDNNDVHRRRV